MPVAYEFVQACAVSGCSLPGGALPLPCGFYWSAAGIAVILSERSESKDLPANSALKHGDYAKIL